MNIAVRGNIRRMGIFGYTILIIIIIINKVDITTPHDIIFIFGNPFLSLWSLFHRQSAAGR